MTDETDIEVTRYDGKVLFRLQSQDCTSVGDLIAMIGNGILRTEDGVLKANKALVLEPGTYIWTERQDNQKQPLERPLPSLPETAYEVRLEVLGARMSAGARGNIFKKLQEHHAVYDATTTTTVTEGQQSEEESSLSGDENNCCYGGGGDANHVVKYVEDDLIVNALFLEQADAFNFQNDVSEWDMHKELVNLSGITIDPKTPVEIDRPNKVSRIMLQDYKPNAFESPCVSLNDLSSYKLFVPPTEAVDPGTPLAKYQCLDKQPPGLLPYKSHLKDKTRFKSMQNDENNLLAVSWSLHQMMDGINTDQGLPMVSISVRSKGKGQPSIDHDNRFPVTLLLKFRDENHANMFQPNDTDENEINDEGGSRRIDGTNNWEVVVYVTEPKTFCACVNWKHGDTKRQWAQHEAFLQKL